MQREWLELVSVVSREQHQIGEQQLELVSLRRGPPVGSLICTVEEDCASWARFKTDSVLPSSGVGFVKERTGGADTWSSLHVSTYPTDHCGHQDLFPARSKFEADGAAWEAVIGRSWRS